MREQTYAYARDLADFVSPSAIAVIKRQLYDVPFQTLAEATIDANREMLVALRGSDFREGRGELHGEAAAEVYGEVGESEFWLQPVFALRATPGTSFALRAARLRHA